MDDLVAFLRARYDEDEEAARLADAVDPSPWYEDVEEGSYTNQRQGLDGVGLVRAADHVALWDREQSCTLSMAGVTATHVALHDPARVLREVEAKRRILDECAWATKNGGGGAFVRPVLRLLALPYSGHAGYEPDWAPIR
ncbi:DUF6221 family protein [Actinacidiphila rubida]|uniref:Uncharacterized protein n=1 Tax=Actinacidiphila rubida TaxID=310780 RepID=A0A1H8T070_9ACTN|nr:DUF6221 family protein [Actinacidiphila rubida]SEO83974.1 hypothetical protein SAMN05216267_104677 [Actinacidiphila rubida]